MLKWMFTYARNTRLGLKRLTETATPLSDPTYRLPRRAAHPRRARCGLSLFEAVLVMMIAVPIAQQGVRLAEHYIRQQAGVQESRLLTQVVTAASTYALRGGLQAFITDRIGVGSVRHFSRSLLEGVDALLSTAARTSRRREIQVIFHARGSEELVVLAHAFTSAGKNTRPYMPRGGIGIGLVGSVVLAEDQNMWLRGPGLDYPLVGLQAQGIDHPPVVGDHLAIAVLRMDQDVLPYLHRDKVLNHPEATRMETDLDMRGKNIIGAGEVNAAQVISTKIEANLLVAEEIITGDCTGCDKRPPNTEGKTKP